MLELYNFSQSTCSLKVRVCLHEKKLNWKDNRLISSHQDHLKPWYLKINPNGVVPTLIHNKNALYESSVILEYLDEVFPEIKLSPNNLYKKSLMRSWIVFVDELLTPAIRYPSFQYGGLLKKFKKLTLTEFNLKFANRPTKESFYKKMDKDNGFSKEILTDAFNDIIKCSKRLDNMFDQFGGPWVMGKRFGIGDIVIGPLLDRIEDLGLEQLWEKKYPRVSNWLSKFQKRKSVIKSFYKGSRLSEQYPELNLGRNSKSNLLNTFQLNYE
tara:strand:- start:2212 stop:3018 length:807 start_codon:yes stop_codon:yes gene_type:complete